MLRRRGYAGVMAPASSRRKKGKASVQFRSEALAQALEKQDMAAVALALRNGNTVVPLMKPTARDNPLDPGTGQVALLLFSDALHKPENLPPAVGLQSPGWLLAFLRTHRETITTVFLDIAGPHPMQASPDDLIAALAG
jgi:hypothetical protein